MKKWTNPEVAELNINETANGDHNSVFESSFFNTNDDAHGFIDGAVGTIEALIELVTGNEHSCTPSDDNTDSLS